MNKVGIGSDNGLSPIWCQGIIQTSAIGPLGTNFSEFVINIQKFSFTKMHLKMSSGKWQPFCPGGDELKTMIHGWAPSGTMPLPEPILTQIYVAIWHYCTELKIHLDLCIAVSTNIEPCICTNRWKKHISVFRPSANCTQVSVWSDQDSWNKFYH